MDDIRRSAYVIFYNIIFISSRAELVDRSGVSTLIIKNIRPEDKGIYRLEVWEFIFRLTNDSIIILTQGVTVLVKKKI